MRTEGRVAQGNLRENTRLAAAAAPGFLLGFIGDWMLHDAEDKAEEGRAWSRCSSSSR